MVSFSKAGIAANWFPFVLQLLPSVEGIEVFDIVLDNFLVLSDDLEDGWVVQFLLVVGGELIRQLFFLYFSLYLCDDAVLSLH